MEKLLVLEEPMRAGRLKSGLGREFSILECGNNQEAMELFLGHAPKVVLLDLEPAPGSRSGGEGLRLLKWMIESRPGTKVVVITGAGEREFAHRALRHGAYDFHLKPIDPAELKIIIQRALYLHDLEEQKCRLEVALNRSRSGIEGIAGQCAAIGELLASLQRAVLSSEKPDALNGQRVATTVQQGRVEVTLEDAPSNNQKEELPSVRQGENFTFPTEHLTLREVRDRVEKGMITAAVGNCRGNMVRASELLGVSRPALYDLMKKHGLFRQGARH